MDCALDRLVQFSSEAAAAAVPMPSNRSYADRVQSKVSWLGDCDRFEIVKSLVLCPQLSLAGAAASASAGGDKDKGEAEELLDRSVRLLEDAEAAAIRNDFAGAASRICIVLERVPSLALGWYRLGLALGAAGRRQSIDSRAVPVPGPGPGPRK